MEPEALPEPAKYMLMALYAARRPLDRLPLVMTKLSEAIPGLK